MMQKAAMDNRILFRKSGLILLFAVISLFSGCEKKSEYQLMVEKELSSGVRNDSLFLGYTFGMEMKEFFDHSWNLNQQKIVTGQAFVEYKLDDELSNEAKMVFYPSFHEEKIYHIPVDISFMAWAPWNRDLFSDHLIEELLEYYEGIYGAGFVQMPHPESGVPSWIKIDGNRQIMIYSKDDRFARVEFLDLSVDPDEDQTD